MNALRTDCYYLYRLDGRGRVYQTDRRKTYRGIDNLVKRRGIGLDSPYFVVAAFVVVDERADDMGTVYFHDLAGNPVEVINS